MPSDRKRGNGHKLKHIAPMGSEYYVFMKAGPKFSHCKLSSILLCLCTKSTQGMDKWDGFELEAIIYIAKQCRWHQAEPITFIKSCTWQEQVLSWQGFCVEFNLLDDLARQTFSIDACSCLMLSS